MVLKAVVIILNISPLLISSVHFKHTGAINGYLKNNNLINSIEGQNVL